MAAFASIAQDVVVRLAWTSLQATLLIGAVWLLNRQLPRLSAATRSLLWWLLGVQLLLGLLLPTPVALPLLSPARTAIATATTTVADGPSTGLTMSTTAPAEHRIAGMGQTGRSSLDAFAMSAEARAKPAGENPHVAWSRVLPVAFALWLAGVLVQLAMTMRQWREARAVVRASRSLDDPRLQALCAAQARDMGLRRCPSLRVSDAIRSPQVSGLWRPVVLLPAAQGLSAEESALALAHELTHLRRGDLWMGWVPGIAQRLFFFHPMVLWAMREYALNREAACDAQVVQRHDAAPQDYGRLLLRLGVAHPLHAGLAGASPTFHNLKRRLMLLQLSGQDTTSRLRSGLIIALVAAIGVLPYRVTEAKAEATPAPATSSGVAASPSPSSALTPTPATPATPTEPATPSTPATPASHALARPSMAPPPPPSPPRMPKVPPPPPAPPVEATGFAAHHVDIDTRSGATYGFAVLDHDSVIVNGSDVDLSTARRMQGNGAPLVLFRRGSDTYLIRDEAYVARAKAAYAPVTELSKEQGQLGGKQGRIGGEEAGIGARMGALGERLSRIAQRESELAVRLAQQPSADRGDGERAGFAAERAEIEREQAGLEHEQRDLEGQQQALSKEQQALSEKLQQASAKANDKMNQLLDEALAKGAAKAVENR
ncbi:M56 family metallopeptidase [Dyella japonica]|uniref:Peptidase M56 domain-containing protein n=1 Tax=Dyella japonica A8 TaxID=1217721 RepID=A0A075JVG6_9GAMM|nr:M56 family metallopeptidase [Dyella japonica]AIF45919.1 hypothetical protein HY57_00880 [Dyella japonica A8]